MLVTWRGLYHLPVSPENQLHSLLHMAPQPVLSPPTKNPLPSEPLVSAPGQRWSLKNSPCCCPAVTGTW